MNTKCSILTGLLTFLITFSGISQEIIEKDYFDSNKKLGKDVVIKKSTVKVEDSKTYKIFEIESPDNGNYYMNAWIMGGELDSIGSGKFLEYDLSVNSEKLNQKIKPENNNWHNTTFKDDKSKEKKTVKLKKGLNHIVFSCDAPEIPEIEFVRLSKDKIEAEISNENYISFVEVIKQKAKEEKEKKKDSTKIDTLGTMLKSAVLSNPAGNYYHHVDVDVKYTWYKRLYISAGGQLSTRVWCDVPVVIEMFSESSPETYSWSKYGADDDEAQYHLTAPVSGYYYFRVRTYYVNTSNTARIRVNGVNYSDCPISNTGFRHPHETPTTYNYFTSNLTNGCDTRIWISDDTWPGKIKAFNDDYASPGFHWGYASRVKKDFSVRIGATLISSYSSYSPVGKCDVYIKCENSTAYTSFPNLADRDAIQSAPTSNNYNCASWGGGKIDLGRYFWASNPPTSTNLSSPWYISGNFWQSWDNFFGNNPSRFTGAPDYTRSGANSSNGEVAMWYNPTSYQYTHFSVTKPANDQPHGYDWESKPGGLMRTFHPRDALNDNSYYGYGQISLYYRRENTTLKSYSLEESVNLGLTVLQDVKLNNEEKEQLNLLKAGIPFETSNKFKEKLNRLNSKANSPEILKHSNPFFLYETTEFSEMIDFCNAQGETVWPLLFENIFFSDNREIEDLSVLIINEVTPNYGYLMEEVKEEWSINNYTQDGAYIAPSPVANTKNYAKKLLTLKSGSESASAANEFSVDNHELFSVFPNPFKYQTNIKFNVIEDNSNVTLKVFDINGKLVESVFTNANYSTGSHETTWTANNCEAGLYFFNLTVNGKSMNRRFLIE